MRFGGLEDDREDSTAPHITFRPQKGGHRQCGLAICTFHLGFSLVRRFNEENNEEAGEHWTPRDAVELMAQLVFQPVADQINSGTYLL